jgi:hypothetical protein
MTQAITHNTKSINVLVEYLKPQKALDKEKEDLTHFKYYTG